MKQKTILLFIIFSFLFCFAFWKEIHEQPNCYKAGIPKDTDKKDTSIKRLSICLQAETKAIRWRRSMIAAILSTGIIFGLIYNRLPEFNELLLFVSVNYLCFYVMWKNFSNVIVEEAILNGKKNLKKIIS